VLKVTQVGSRKYVRMPNFEKENVKVLKEWFMENIKHPYPSIREKEQMSQQSGLDIKQIQNWFTNARKVSSTTHLTPL
jgi:hypothetical protein